MTRNSTKLSSKASKASKASSPSSSSSSDRAARAAARAVIVDAPYKRKLEQQWQRIEQNQKVWENVILQLFRDASAEAERAVTDSDKLSLLSDIQDLMDQRKNLYDKKYSMIKTPAIHLTYNTLDLNSALVRLDYSFEDIHVADNESISYFNTTAEILAFKCRLMREVAFESKRISTFV